MYTIDPIADMLTRIRNANLARAQVTSVPHSSIKAEIARILYETGFISEFKTQEIEGKKFIRVYLKYTGKRDRIITGITRISHCGRRVYVKHDAIPKILRGMGVVIMSTPKGVMTGHQAEKAHQGGEVLAAIW